MKFIYALSFVSLAITGCNKGEESTQPPVVALAADKMNVLYVGLDNPVTLAYSGAGSDEISVSVDDGTITGDTGKYMVKPMKAGPVFLEAFTSSGDGEKKSVGKVEFRAKPVPDPVGNVFGKYGTADIKQFHLPFIKEVMAWYPHGFEFDVKFQVLSFEVSSACGITDENGKKEMMECTISAKGAFLSEAQKNFISRAKVGAKIYFENIKVLAPDSSIRNIEGVTLQVVN